MLDHVFLAFGAALVIILVASRWNKKRSDGKMPSGSRLRSSMRRVRPEVMPLAEMSLVAAPNINFQSTHNVLETIMHKYKIPGALLLVTRYDEPLIRMALGTTYRPDMLPRHTHNEPIKSDMYFRIGSITKSMTATCVLLLAAKNKLGLHDMLSKWFPLAPRAKNIRLIHMLNMTSGLGDYEQSDTFAKIWYADPEIHWNPLDLIRWAKEDKKPLVEPGTVWHYCNTGYIYLGLIIERVMDVPLHVAFKQLLFDPLGMHQTFLATNAHIRAPHAQGFGNVREKLENVTDWNPGWAWAAGGVVSTLDDLAKWAKNLGEPRLLSSYRQPFQATSLVADKSTIGTSTEHHFNRDYFYGFGLLYDHHWVWHNGSIPGWESMVAYHTPTRMSIVININQSTLPDNHSSESPVTEMFRELVQLYTPSTPLHPKE